MSEFKYDIESDMFTCYFLYQLGDDSASIGGEKQAGISGGSQSRSRSMSCNCMTRTSQQECWGILEIKKLYFLLCKKDCTDKKQSEI